MSTDKESYDAEVARLRTMMQRNNPAVELARYREALEQITIIHLTKVRGEH